MSFKHCNLQMQGLLQTKRARIEGNVRDQWQEGDGGSNTNNEADIAGADINCWLHDTDVMQEESPGLGPLENTISISNALLTAAEDAVMSQSSSLNNTVPPPELLDEVPVQDFADDFAEAILEVQGKRTQLNASGDMAAPPHQPSIAVQEDLSEEVEHKRTLAPMNDFILAFGLWCKTESISRQSYMSLLECLCLLRTVAPIAALPSTVSTLKKNIQAQLLLMQLQRRPLALIPEKLPTLHPQEKPLASSILGEMLYWFDPTKLIQVILSSSEYRERMHIGMANYVDKPSELWESFAWSSSIWACSGEFAKYSDGTPIFPSGIVLLMCCKAGCWCWQGTKKHMGRIHTVGRDYTSKAGTPGEILLSIQKIVDGPNIRRIILDFEVPASNSNSQECFLIGDDVF
ncbi:MAG: hypothetical protein FRX48_02632 [Lasallia pustulata]|uniref:Uncharacterized protein n=1 Tax=Lasallia pustulata TaxID=136370 RepID=A0A5M8PYY7_9LECA|nr:MAG: hypothetical protein FRX48_02632 [Lasallia pustulata]